MLLVPMINISLFISFCSMDSLFSLSFSLSLSLLPVVEWLTCGFVEVQG